jgi:RNA polymerase sigma factor (sigma-70 family)
MINPFSELYKSDKTDMLLIKEAVNGDKVSLEKLIRRHQDWIYNIALRMVFNPDEAADVTQEVLIKIITKLDSFRSRSAFRTWAYRIAVNHVLNMKKSRGEALHTDSFSKYSKAIDNTPDFDFPDKGYSVETRILVEETKVSCMFGMLLCLDREQRLVYILGSIFGLTDKTGAELMQITKVNFRKKLERARRDLHNFMNNKCSLVNPDNPCKCLKKTKALIDSGYVNPLNLKFNRNYYYKVEKAAEERLKEFNSYINNECDRLFIEHPFQNSPDFVENLRITIDKKEFKQIFNFN